MLAEIKRWCLCFSGDALPIRIGVERQPFAYCRLPRKQLLHFVRDALIELAVIDPKKQIRLEDLAAAKPIYMRDEFPNHIQSQCIRLLETSHYRSISHLSSHLFLFLRL
jgi:hypothetical protein